jgi:hypothetical protein
MIRSFHASWVDLLWCGVLPSFGRWPGLSQTRLVATGVAL